MNRLAPQAAGRVGSVPGPVRPGDGPAPSHPAAAPAPAARRARGRLPARWLLPALALALLLLALLAVGQGAYAIPPQTVLHLLGHSLGLDLGPVDIQQLAVLQAIRLPRLALAVLTGAGLATAGVLMQGLFRNPLADPTLIGSSAGAALAASAVIVLLGPGGAGGVLVLQGQTLTALGSATLPLAAFAGSLLATGLVVAIGRGGGSGSMSLAGVLLAGIAVNALAMAGVGLMAYLASDEQLRTLTFWNLGALSAASGPVLLAVAPAVGLALLVAWTLAPALNALALGEARAGHLGLAVGRTQVGAVLAAALATGSVVAFTGMIGFIGLVAPHLVRLLAGPDHRVLIPGAALLGALLVLGADLLARTLVAPAELPIGLLTALIGGPFFIALLRRARGRS